MNTRLFREHTRLTLVELMRLPAFLVPSLAFPLVLFLFFGVPNADSEDSAWALLASFAGFAVLGVMLFQFGVGIASEGDQPWERFVRALRAPAGARLAARLFSALVFALLSLVPLTVVGFAFSEASPTASQGLSTLVVVIIGCVPFGLLGIALGYWLHPRGALPITNLIYLPLAYLGGLFQGNEQGPPDLAGVAHWLPTYAWDRMIESAAFSSVELSRVPLLALWTVLFAAAAYAGYRRDEGRSYR